MSDSPSLFEHFFVWLNRHAPQYLDDLRRSFGAPTTKEVLAYYCSTRDVGGWLLDAYYEATGRHLPTDTLAVLRQWFAALRLSRLDRDRAAGWQPVHPAQQVVLLPEDHIKGMDLVLALRPVLGGIYSGSFDFDGERHRVRSLDEQPPDLEHRSPTTDRVEQAMRIPDGPEQTEAEPTEQTEADPQDAEPYSDAQLAGENRYRRVSAERDRVKNAILADLRSGRYSPEDLREYSKRLIVSYETSRGTYERARSKALEAFDRS